MRFLAILCAAAAACSPTDAKTADDVIVTLSSVNLGDDCWSPPPPPPAPAKTAAPAAAPAGVAPPANRKPGTPGAVRTCDQTSMQLTVSLAPSLKPSPVKVKKVELLDAKGKLIEELTARDGLRWDTDKYVAWDQIMPNGTSLKVSYPLTAPAWEKVGGRMTAHEKAFQLRVTVAVGAGSHTVEKQSITPARLPPPVPT